jgi:hypothetical protein
MRMTRRFGLAFRQGGPTCTWSIFQRPRNTHAPRVCSKQGKRGMFVLTDVSPVDIWRQAVGMFWVI